MITQLDLAAARQTDPDTSHQAARDISGSIVNAVESKVLTAINCRYKEDHWEVWSDTEVTPFDGRCVGHGDTYQEAIQDAIRELSEDMTVLKNVELNQKLFEMAVIK